MKSTDLAKNMGLKIIERSKHAATPERFAQGAAAVLDRKAQRKLDQAQGLIPFSVKLNQALVERIREQALNTNASINDVVADLLEKGLEQTASGK
jgi:hypothetical protein